METTLDDTVIEVKASVILDMLATEVRKAAGDRTATEAVADRIAGIANAIKGAASLTKEPPSAAVN
jgi:hypothetical protein